VQGGDGSWVELASLGIKAITSPQLAEAAAALAALDVRKIGGGIVDPPVLAPVVAPGKIMAIGLNYADHIRETNSQRPVSPILFSKYNTSIAGPFDAIVADPAVTSMVDYEGELTAIIGRRIKRISEADALDAVFGYTVTNDVTARDCMKIDIQLDRAKGIDTFCPIGPWITTADAVPDPQALGIRTWVNGELRQNSSTKEMIFSVAQLISFLSQGMTLEPGDLLVTGTPHGVGFKMNPPRFLVPGDVVEVEVEGLGKLRNPVVGPG
jgi:5-carboxymethyl-2-hydroxymuconate isomerase